MPDVGSGLSAGIGLFTADKSARAAEAAGDAAGAAELEQVAFAKERYEDWKEVFGPIQDNLSAYYQSLSPAYFAARGIESFEEEQEKALTRINERFAQLGLEDSGIAAAVEVQAELAGAEERARIRADAPSQVAAEQSDFLRIGIASDPSGDVTQALGQRTASAQNRAATARGSAGVAAEAAIGAVTTGITQLFGN